MSRAMFNWHARLAACRVVRHYLSADATKASEGDEGVDMGPQHKSHGKHMTNM